MTIYDIAKEAGVSASTVSRVVNNKPGIHPDTRKKIKQLLEKYNYSPNETARGLVNQSTKIIGILVSDIRTIHHTDGAYFIERELTKLGYNSMIFNTGTEESSKAEYIKILSRRRVEGAVLIGSSFQTETVKHAIQKYLSTPPIIMANGYIDLPNVYGVLADEQQGVSDCVDLLFDKGHKNPAFVLDFHTPSNDLKLLGYRKAVRDKGGKPFIYETKSSLEGVSEVTKMLVDEHPEVDGIIYSVDLLAAGGVRALKDMGIDVPGKIAVIGIDDSIYAKISNPRLTSLDNKLLDLSITSARILIDALNERKLTKKIMLFSEIVERETT